MNRHSFITRTLLPALALLAIVAALAFYFWSAATDPSSSTSSRVTFDDNAALRVMTYNVYVGSGFEPVLAARSPAQFAAGVTEIMNAVRAGDPPGRMAAIADEI